MTPPPMLPTAVFDPAIKRRRSSKVPQTTRHLPAEAASQVRLSADIDNILPTVNKNINDLDPENNSGNASPIPIINNSLARNIIFEDLAPNSQNIIKILENTIAIKKLLEQQNKFLEQCFGTTPVVLDQPTAGPSNSNNNCSIVPTRPFKKHRKLLQFDTSLKNNEDGKKQLEKFFYLLGGDSPQSQIKCSLEKIFTNKLAMKYSWTGRKGNFAHRARSSPGGWSAGRHRQGVRPERCRFGGASLQHIICKEGDGDSNMKNLLLLW
ncbi:uncharacterized protein [Temnothorax nylanderi]|uniref:uncharacterized protein n=1 Tax=Temnothorax nylanderi TaxID=102681 RepID=UPI003A8B776F